MNRCLPLTNKPLILNIFLAATLLFTACQADEPEVDPFANGEVPDTLSAWGFFQGPLDELVPTAGVMPYKVASPLWSDHADKGRFLRLPPGESITAIEGEPWLWPQGSLLIKTFFFSLDRRQPEGEARIIETRLLRLEEEGWTSYIYVWNEEQTEATLTKVGKRVMVSHTDAQGQSAEQLYLVPNLEECKSCHEIEDALLPLGLAQEQLGVMVIHEGQQVHQLALWQEMGLVEGLEGDPQDLFTLPDPMDEDAAVLEDRARSYLHGNCGHCHREGGGGGRSGLRLVWWEERDNRIGICKSPVAAGSGSGGRTADIVPGSPEDSIMLYRMSSTDPETKMPELPNLLPDEAGIALIEEWIGAMEPVECP